MGVRSDIFRCRMAAGFGTGALGEVLRRGALRRPLTGRPLALGTRIEEAVDVLCRREGALADQGEHLYPEFALEDDAVSLAGDCYAFSS